MTFNFWIKNDHLGIGLILSKVVEKNPNYLNINSLHTYNIFTFIRITCNLKKCCSDAGRVPFKTSKWQENLSADIFLQRLVSDISFQQFLNSKFLFTVLLLDPIRRLVASFGHRGRGLPVFPVDGHY